MLKIATPLLIVFTSLVCLAQQPAPAPAPASSQPARVIIQTPFGPKEVDASTVPPGVPTTPVTSSTQPPAVVAPPPSIPAAPAPAPPPAAQVQDGDSPISINLDNVTDIYQIIKIMGDALKLNYIVDPGVKGTININTAGTLRRSDLLPILEAILKINGATMIKTGNFYEIVPSGTAVKQPLEVQERNSRVAPDDQMILQVIRMQFVSAAEMSKLLSPYLSDGANIVAQDAGNILLVTERRSNLRKLLEIVDLFDSSAFVGERVRMYPAKSVLATEMAGDLKTIFAGYGGSEANSPIRFVPLTRLNSILVVTSNAAVFPEIEKWIERLDQSSASASGSMRPFIYKVKNAKAVDLQRLLGQLYGTQVQLSANYQTPGNVVGATPSVQAPPATQPLAGTALFSSPQAAPTPAATGFSMTGQVRVIADENNNALIIQTTPQLYAEIERMLMDLDVQKRQVLIDAQIYEVSLDDSMSLGLSAMLRDRAAGNSTTASFVTPGTGAPSLVGSTFALIGGSRELVMFLNAQENRSRVRTLSAPSILVSDNVSADFQVGAEVPIPTSTAATPVQTGGTNFFAQTIAFRDTGVLMRVKPQINEGGMVSLEMSQEVSQASANTTSGITAPVIGKSSVNTSIVVQDGQTIAISGFIRENNELSRQRIPLLGRIPGVGLLFGNTRRASTRSELIVLITPHVIRTRGEADAATEELKEKLREVKKLLK